MKKTMLSFACGASLVLAATAGAQDNDLVQLRGTAIPADQTPLVQAASGDAIAVGDTHFRLVPGATVRPTKAGPVAGQQAAAEVGDYTITLPAAGVAARSARSMPVGSEKLAAAVSEDGLPVVVTSQVRVFFRDAAALQRQARATGASVVSISTASGLAILDYGTVAAALQSFGRLQGAAGIRGAEPDLIQWEERPQ
jgi:hypothetical protein